MSERSTRGRQTHQAKRRHPRKVTLSFALTLSILCLAAGFLLGIALSDGGDHRTTTTLENPVRVVTVPSGR